MSLAERLPSPPTVREALATALAGNKRPTLHELERAAALHGHTAIEVEIVLKSLIRAHDLVRIEVFVVPEPEPELVGRVDEDGAPLKQIRGRQIKPLQRTLRLVERVKAAPPLARVDIAESAREEVTNIIARVQESSKAVRRQLCSRDIKGWWSATRATLGALGTGEVHHPIHPERAPALLAKQASVMLCNWRTAGQLRGRFKCRVSNQGVFITRIQ